MHQILKSFILLIYKKGSLILGLLPFFILLTSCQTDWSRYGKVSKNSSASNDYFIFSVSEEYINANKNSVADEENPKLTKAESKLLYNLLKQKEYCLSEDGEISFRITSKQEKVYDMTFAHLIEEHYNARPLTPVIYYGRCFDEKSLKKKIKSDLEKIKLKIN